MKKTKDAIVALDGWHKADIRVTGKATRRVVLERGTCTLRDGAPEGKGGAK